MKHSILLIVFLFTLLSGFAQERRISVKQVQHTIAINAGEAVFGRATMWYEYRNTDLFGVRFPFGYNFQDERVMFGINPKAYFGYGLVQLYLGPKIIFDYLLEPLPPVDDFSKERYMVVEMYLDMGINFTNYKHIPFHFSINCGIGGESSGQSDKLVINPGISIGYNIK
ncbi:MAG: hypothetical protein ACI8ZO_000964 [Flavobacteriales bacterium]|jgi:hypothetical protein